MANYQDLKRKYMSDPEFRKEYEAIQPEMDAVRAIIDARVRQDRMQAQTAEQSTSLAVKDAKL